MGFLKRLFWEDNKFRIEVILRVNLDTSPEYDELSVELKMFFDILMDTLKIEKCKYTKTSLTLVSHPYKIKSGSDIIGSGMVKFIFEKQVVDFLDDFLKHAIKTKVGEEAKINSENIYVDLLTRDEYNNELDNQLISVYENPNNIYLDDILNGLLDLRNKKK